MLTALRRLIVIGLIFALVGAVLLTASLPHQTTLAQDTDTTPTPVEETGLDNAPYDPIAEATGIAIQATYEAEWNSRSVLDFNVAYLVARDAVATDHLTSPQTFTQTFGAQSFDTWESFARANAQQPFQIVMIHRSMADQVDVNWTRWAYRHAIFIVGISIPHEQLAAIIDDRCMWHPNPYYAELYADFWVFFSFNTQLEDERYREHVADEYLHTCTDSPDLGGTSGVTSHGVGDFPITDSESLRMLDRRIITRSIGYGIRPVKNDLLPLPPAQPDFAPDPELRNSGGLK